jgi:transposase-like protein
MNQTTTSPKTGKPIRRRRTPSPAYSAQDKAQAILAVWTERARPAEVCRQLSINWITFSHWQDRAMEGMLQALESRVNLSKGEALSPRLRNLISRRLRQNASAQLSSRLEKIQAGKAPEPEAT